MYDLKTWDHEHRFKRLVVFTEHEHGAAPWIAAQAKLAGREPTAVLMSHMIDHHVFNDLPDLHTPGWEVFVNEDNSTVYLNINEWPDTPLMPPESAKATWLRVYPAIRDALTILRNVFFGAMHTHSDPYDMVFLTTTTMHDVLDPEHFAKVPTGTVVEWSLDDPVDLGGKSIFTAPTAWLFPLIHRLQTQGRRGDTRIVVAGHEPDARVDVAAAEALASKLGGYADDERDNLLRAVDEMKERHESFDEMMADINQALRNTTTNIPTKNGNPMWG